VEATIESNLAAWNAAFADYTKFTSKQPQEALEHKVRALGVALWKGFTAHQFGGVPRARGIALSQLATRTGEHRGTTVRSTLMAEYLAARSFLRAKARAIRQSLRNFGGTLDQWSGLSSALAANSNQRLGAWHDIVGREIKARQAGIGALGAAFLWYRSRGKGEARRYVLNRSGKSMGEVTVNEGGALIAANVAGINTVDARYSVVAQAIADETDDTMKYVKQKQDEAAAKLAREILE
jgi:hypothetical protein